MNHPAAQVDVAACTSRPLDPSNPRPGRWQGQKLERGMHIQVK
jgi:hypothetical protein